jgi:hypothetical protein
MVFGVEVLEKSKAVLSIVHTVGVRDEGSIPDALLVGSFVFEFAD